MLLHVPQIDPRKHIVSIFYSLLVDAPNAAQAKGCDDAVEAAWITVKDIYTQVRAGNGGDSSAHVADCSLL